jgi:protein involved in polysaccharide export with SLBB domain
MEIIRFDDRQIRAEASAGQLVMEGLNSPRCASHWPENKGLVPAKLRLRWRCARPYQHSKTVTLLLLIAIAGCVSGCADYPLDLVPAVPNPTVDPYLYQPQVEPEYRIEPGDSLLIQSYFDPALRQNVNVRPDGRVSLLLIGDVMVAGKTVRAANDLLRQRYASKLPDKPDVSVTMNEAAGLLVYVGGEVKTPSVVPIKGSLTLMQAIAQAGGFLPGANQDQVIILRHRPDGTFTAQQQNTNLVLRNEAPELYLRRRDIVYVPKSKIAQVDLFVDQYINQVIPRAVQATFGYTILRTVGGSPTVNLPR